MNKKCFSRFPLLLTVLLAVFCGCFKETYPGDRIRESIADICRNEYGIDQIEVKTAGSTVGVYLPMDKLFAADFKEVLRTGNVGSLEKLFEPSAEAFDKIENVLFSISRALLSTDREFKFYELAAADVRQTGYQISIIGSVDDIRRVRIWDISKNEYRRRIVTEWGDNPLALWHQPVRQFFKDLETLPVEVIRKQYFTDNDHKVSNEVIQNLFYGKLLDRPEKEIPTRWEFLDLKSLPLQKSERVVFAKVQPVPQLKKGKAGLPPPELKYLMVVNLSGSKPELAQVVPFQFLDSKGVLKTVEVPDNLKFDENDESWEEEFHVEEITMGSFLANQLTRRVQAMLMEDERIHNTFKDLKLDFQYDNSETSAYFTLNIDAMLADESAAAQPSEIYHEDLVYMLRKILPEFASVVRSYRFDAYDSLKLNIIRETSSPVLMKKDIELFHKKKIDLEKLLSGR